MFEAFFLVGQEILYENSWCSKYFVVVNSRELQLHLPSEKQAFERYKWEEEKNRDGKHTEQSLKVQGTRYKVKEEEKNF